MNTLDTLRNIQSIDDITIKQVEWQGEDEGNFHFTLDINGLIVHYSLGIRYQADDLYDFCEDTGYIKNLTRHNWKTLLEFIGSDFDADGKLVAEETKQLIKKELNRIEKIRPIL